MATINGKEIVVLFGTAGSEKQILCTTNATLNLDQDQIEGSCKDVEGDWKKNIAGNKGWNVSFDGLYDPEAPVGEGFIDLADLIITGPNEVTLIIGQQATGETFWTGLAMLQTTNLNAPDNAFADFSGTFLGNGPLTKETVQA